VGATALAGGVSALVIVAFLDPQGQLAHIDTAAVILGASAGIGLHLLFRASSR